MTPWASPLLVSIPLPLPGGHFSVALVGVRQEGGCPAIGVFAFYFLDFRTTTDE